MSDENKNEDLENIHDLEFSEESKNSEEISASEGEEVNEEASEDANEEVTDGPSVDESSSDDEVAAEKEYLAPEQVESIIETILFTSDRPVGLAAIKAAFKGTTVRKNHILEAIERLTTEMAGGRRGISLEIVAGGYQLRSKIDNAKFLRNMGKAKTFKLTGPSLETLAIVAYKQPLTKAEVDHIRGVESGHLVRALMDRGLLAFAGKSDAPGKPMQYGTTKKFLEIFGLRNSKELPSLSEIDELIPQGIDETEGEKMQIHELAEKLGDSAISNYSVGEEELLEISEELTKITASTDFFEEEKRRQREKRDRERAEDIRQALTFGEEVPETDSKWLQKYEANLAKVAAEAAATVAASVSPEVEGSETSVSEASPISNEVNFESESSEVVVTDPALVEPINSEEPKPTDG